MTEANLYAAIFLVGLVALFPLDAINLVALVAIKARLHAVNLRMWLLSYRMWRKLDRDMKKNYGTSMPPFKYTHIWDRDPVN